MRKVKVTALISSFGAFVRRLIHWTGDRLKDLFYATGNENLELGRVGTGVGTALIVFAMYWNAVHLGKEIDLSGLLNGLAAFSAATGIGILAKDWARGKFKETAAKIQEKKDDSA